MKRFYTIFIFLAFASHLGAQSMLLSAAAPARSNYQLLMFANASEMGPDSQHKQKELFSTLNSLETKARKKYHKNPSVWLERIFYLVQRKELKRYENYVSLSQTVTDGKYDCVTGTALYALLLDRLRVNYEILEFPFHTALIIQEESNSIMFESTDPLTGFVTDQEEIERRINFYTTQEAQSPFIRKITIKELAGLHHYNLAVNNYNEQQYSLAYRQLEKANALYSSERIQFLKRQVELQKTNFISSNY